jgi:hypothetical protein
VLLGLVALVGTIVLIVFVIARNDSQIAPLQRETSSLWQRPWPNPSRSELSSKIAPAVGVDSQSRDPQKRVAAPLASRASIAETAAPSARVKRFVNGVEAVKAIDWNSVRSFSPIPRLMPTGSATDAVDAGFAPEWFERSIDGWGADSINYHGEFASIAIQPLASRIMSESRSADDDWANGVESKLRSMIADGAPATAATTSRVFCNGEGCLCYLESEDPAVSSSSRPTLRILLSVRDDPWAQAYGISPLGVYRLGTRNWDLILIPRSR